MDSEFSEIISIPNKQLPCSDILTTGVKLKKLLEKFEHVSLADEKKGVSLLNVKADAMFAYLSNVLYVMLKKCCGMSIIDDKLRARLSEVRIILEKIKPLELKLKYQIEKYLKMMNAEKSDVLDKSNFRAKLENLTAVEDDQVVCESGDECNDADSENDVVDGDDGEIISTKKSMKTQEKANVPIYKPPKVVAVPYDDSNEEEKRKRKLEQSKKRALSTSIMQELREEYLDTPLEISNAVTLRNKRTNHQQEKESYEETYFTRLPTSKKERHRDKLMNSLTLGSLGSEVTRFEDISALEERDPWSSNKRKMKPSAKKKKKGFKKRRLH